MKSLVLFFGLVIGTGAQAYVLLGYDSMPPVDVPIKMWEISNPDGVCKIGWGTVEKTEVACKIPRGNVFSAYGDDEVTQQTLQQKDAVTGKTTECRVAVNSTITVLKYDLSDPNNERALLSYRNSKRIGDRVYRFFNSSQMPIKLSLKNQALPLCATGTNYSLDVMDMVSIWLRTLDVDFGMQTDYRLGEANIYDQAIHVFQIDALVDSQFNLIGVVDHPYEAFGDKSKILETFDAAKSKEVLSSGKAAHPEQAVYTNEAYAYYLDRAISVRYFSLNGVCYDHDTGYKPVDSGLCASAVRKQP